VTLVTLISNLTCPGAIGRSLIYLLPEPVTATQVTLHVLAAKALPSFRLFAVPNPTNCSVEAPRPGKNKCDLIQNTEYLGHAYEKSASASVAACCARCRSNAKCAFFTFHSASAKAGSCALMTAQTGEKKHAVGWVSGSPVR
jgi:hypothetical protein